MQGDLAQVGIAISTDPGRLDLDWIVATLHTTYWAKNVTRETVERAIEHSIVFGVYEGERQVGFTRAVTDRATFAWLADVLVDPAYRGRGIGVRLVEAALGHPELQGLRRWLLATRDAHGLYEKFGFRPLPEPERFMEISTAEASWGR